MANMRQNSTTGDPEWKLRKHTKAIRENQLPVACMLAGLHGIPIDLSLRMEPLIEWARECFEELEPEAQIGVWSCSTKAGGIWTPEQRKILVGR